MRTVLQIGLWLGLLPSMGIAGVMHGAAALGADSWPDILAFVVFGAAYLAMVGAGAWVFSKLRY